MKYKKTQRSDLKNLTQEQTTSSVYTAIKVSSVI